jgi:uncharacterized protein YegL
MPRIDTDMDTHAIGGGSFSFTGARIQRLGATEYTLVTIALDASSSVAAFEGDLMSALRTAVEACAKSPRAENLLVRVVKFSTGCASVEELHGFKLLADVDIAAYPRLAPSGATPLYDAVYSALSATNVYAKTLHDQDVLVNAILFVVTDGCENASVATAAMIKREIAEAQSREQLESLVSVLIGINAGAARHELAAFQSNAGITHYVEVADASRQRLAKLAAFVSQSISSQSQALGTGGPGQRVVAVI